MAPIAICGHTMATPGLPLLEAIQQFPTFGIDGIEIIWQDNYLCGLPESVNTATLQEVARCAADTGIRIAGLCPYMRETNSLDGGERASAIDRFKKCIDDAAGLGGRSVRFYGGGLHPGSGKEQAERWKHLAESLHIVADHGRDAGVRVLVENHMGTMTESARDTVQLVHDADSDGAGVLYDQVNLFRSGAEGYQEALELQGRYIHHVHVKDFEPGGTDRKSVRSAPPRAVGDGTMPWDELIPALAATGYEGYLSLEYETRWNPEDLPAPEVGLPRSAQHLRRILAGLGERGED